MTQVYAFDKFGKPAAMTREQLQGCVPCRMAGLGGAPMSMAPVKQDIVAAVVAFGVPLAYDRYAIKKHKKRYGRWANAGAVVGIYFATSLLYRAYAS